MKNLKLLLTTALIGTTSVINASDLHQSAAATSASASSTEEVAKTTDTVLSELKTIRADRTQGHDAIRYKFLQAKDTASKAGNIDLLLEIEKIDGSIKHGANIRYFNDLLRGAYAVAGGKAVENGDVDLIIELQAKEKAYSEKNQEYKVFAINSDLISGAFEVKESIAVETGNVDLLTTLASKAEAYSKVEDKFSYSARGSLVSCIDHAIALILEKDNFIAEINELKDKVSVFQSQYGNTRDLVNSRRIHNAIYDRARLLKKSKDITLLEKLKIKEQLYAGIYRDYGDLTITDDFIKNANK